MSTRTWAQPGRLPSDLTGAANVSSIDEDDVFEKDLPEESRPNNQGDETQRRMAAGRQYGYTGPLADIMGAANRLKSVPADHDLRVLKTHQMRQRDLEGEESAAELRIRQNQQLTQVLCDDIIHKTILVGDSGVGKTSLLVQFDTGKFNLGAFSATVGIGFTVMLVGDSGVGKTCFMVQFNDGKFLSGTFIATVGIDFRNKIINVDGTKVKLQIWDTAGQERFRSVTHAYYRDAHALLLLYDVTNRKSYNNTRAWLGEIREYAQGDVVILLLGNKSDCKLDREVSKEDGEKLAREYNVPFMETSAKTSLNVEFAFNAVARELIHKRSSYPEDPRFNVKEYIETKSEKTDPGGRCLCV